MRTGRVEAVWLERHGSEMLTDAPSGTQVLSVGFTGDFDEEGGQLQHVESGDIYDYSAADPDAETVTLASPLPVGKSFAAGDALRVYPLSDDLYAHVRLEDVESDDEPISARVSHPLRGLLEEGTRDTQGETVLVDIVEQEWVVQDIVGTPSRFIVGDVEGTVEIGPQADVLLKDPDGQYVQLTAQIGSNNPGITYGMDYGAASDPRLLTYSSVASSGKFLWIAQALNSGASTFGALVLHDDAVGFGDRTGNHATWQRHSTGFLYAGGFNSEIEPTYEVWNNLALQNGWAAVANHLVPGYKKLPHGSVELCGSMSGGTTANGTIIATLPSGYRPSADVRIPIMSNASGAVGGGEARAVIRGIVTSGANPAGTIEIFGLAAGASISLDGCTFPLDR